jgi:hypothetical protein
MASIRDVFCRISGPHVDSLISYLGTIKQRETLPVIRLVFSPKRQQPRTRTWCPDVECHTSATFATQLTRDSPGPRSVPRLDLACVMLTIDYISIFVSLRSLVVVCASRCLEYGFVVAS